MTKTPKPAGKTAAKPRAAAKAPAAHTPADLAHQVGASVGHAFDRAIDPLTSALKRASQRRADRSAAPDAAMPAAAPGKPGLAVSPLAVPFPTIPPIAGVEIATGRAGFYKHERDDLRFEIDVVNNGVEGGQEVHHLHMHVMGGPRPWLRA